MFASPDQDLNPAPINFKSKNLKVCCHKGIGDTTSKKTTITPKKQAQQIQPNSYFYQLLYHNNQTISLPTNIPQKPDHITPNYSTTTIRPYHPQNNNLTTLQKPSQTGAP